jgi:hypothetical protein
MNKKGMRQTTAIPFAGRQAQITFLKVSVN